ncbi:MAG TPA: hypothetical protein VFT99_05665 [Roseiflexaceae bacterium]|nr:hypothetical protein [Roseiflexaceae bacterium]
MLPPAQICSTITAALQAARISNPAILDEQQRQHVQGCDTCLHALLALLPQGVQLVPQQQHIGCAECQQHLAEYMELEDADPILAIRTYPHIWWHLWTCEQCTQVYLTSRELFALPQPALPALPREQPALTPLAHINRATLGLLFPDDPAYRLRRSSAGAMPHNEANETIIFEQFDDEHELVISVWDTLPAGYRLEVRCDPVPDGELVLRCGLLILSAPFDAHGQALISHLAAAVLSDPAAPDLHFFIQMNAP